MMKIAIIGAGHGAYSLSADLTLAGHEVRLCELPDFKENLAPILERGGIELSGISRQGFAKISKVTTDMGEAVKDAKLIMVSTIANAHKTVAELCAPHLEDGQTMVLFPGTAGSLEVNRILKDKGVQKDIMIAEGDTFPYACRRVMGQAKTEITIVSKVHVAAFPAKNTDKVISILKETSDMYFPGKNALEIGFGNPNPMGHVAGTLLNTGYIEASAGKFQLWKQGMSPSVLRGIEAVYKERDAIFNKLGYTIRFTYELHRKLIDTPGLQAAWGPTDMKFRYLTEDVPNGLVGLASIGDMIGTPTPIIKAFITIASMINETDYWKEGRTVEKLGIAGMTADQLNKFLDEGKK
jgi:opine dehydrogenase